jgi:hypothetical protein
MIPAILLFLLLLAPDAYSMSSAGYRLDWFTPLTTGGGGASGSPSYAVNITVGQSVIGATSSTGYKISLGYWYSENVPTVPAIQVTPSILNFGYVPPGSYKDLILMVKNTGGGVLTGTVTASLPFSVISGGTYNLGAGQPQQVVVRYTAPLEEGSQTGSLTFTGGGGITIQAKGTNKQVGLPWLMLLLD